MSIKKWQVWGFIFTVVAGTLLHFTYEWSGYNPLVGLFSAVNESTWEHLKLLITPMLVFGVLEYSAYGKDLANFIPVRCLSILLGMTVIVVSFYTYVGIIGHNYLPADIGVFVLGAACAYRYSARLLGTSRFTSPAAVRLGWIGLAMLVAAMIVFTLHPPKLGLFVDPNHG